MEEYLMGFDSGFFGVTESQVPLLLWRVGPVEPGSCQAAWQALLMDPIQRNSLEVGVLATRASRHKKWLLLPFWWRCRARRSGNEDWLHFLRIEVRFTNWGPHLRLKVSIHNYHVVRSRIGKGQSYQISAICIPFFTDWMASQLGQLEFFSFYPLPKKSSFSYWSKQVFTTWRRGVSFLGPDATKKKSQDGFGSSQTARIGNIPGLKDTHGFIILKMAFFDLLISFNTI